LRLKLKLRRMTGEASEKGKEAAVTRKLVERVRKLGGADAIRSLLVRLRRTLYAGGPLLAWLESLGAIPLTRLPEDRLLFAEGLSVIKLEGDVWRRQTRVLDGHKETRTVEIACASQLTEWDSYLAKVTHCKQAP